MPAALRRQHCTKPGVWGLIQVVDGRLRYRVLDTGTELILDPDHPGVTQPSQMHMVEPLGPVRFFIEFYSGNDGAPDQSADTRDRRAMHG